eukprot:TRINITY_DN35046_c0_g1_i2.p1 TRINITY_DN35046_c0_g1~~TRINITY_DN35046_c0_g1_i2.p1  ORF type:complete len:508 (-),score=56.34 TRINITY_DN35046_c0_g1_i2:27-1550(-)
MVQVWPPLHRSRERACPLQGPPGRTPGRKVVIWWMTKHPAVLQDLVVLLERGLMDDEFTVEMQSHMVSEYCEFATLQPLCTQDVRLKELMRWDDVLYKVSSRECAGPEGGGQQMCGLRRLHGDFDQAIQSFKHVFGPELDGVVDLFMCGHPLYWCRMFDAFERKPAILGIFDVTHNFHVPDWLRNWWTGAFKDMFRDKRNLLVASTVYHAYQAEWLLGLSIPYVQLLGIAAGIDGRYNPLRSDTILVGRGKDHGYHFTALFKMIAALPTFPYKLLRWKDLPCTGHCPKSVLAEHRAVVLDVYDTANFKLSEFYAMAVPIFTRRDCIWRSTMRWGRADAYQGPSDNGTQPGAGDPGRLPDEDKVRQQGWDRIFQDELLQARLWEPWPVDREQQVPTPSTAADAEKRLPFSPFSPDRQNLQPLSAAFWAQFSDWASLPHLIYYDGAVEFFHLASTLTGEELASRSRSMSRHYETMLSATLVFWHEAIGSLAVKHDTSHLKGPDSQGTAG